MFSPKIPLIFACALALGALGCDRDEPVPEPQVAARAAPKMAANTKLATENTSPERAVQASAAALRDNDVRRLVELSVPPDRFDELEKEFRAGLKEEPPTDEEKREFAEMMAKWTAPNAEQVMWAELEPKMTEFKQTYALQMPMYVGMMQMFAGQAIAQSVDMSDVQKTRATEAVTAMASWMQTARFDDPEKAKQAIGIVADAARKLDLKTLDQAHALSFDAMLDKAGTGLASLKQLIGVYGFDVDAALGSVQTRVAKQEGDRATVAVDYQLFDKPMSFETELVERSGRWYGAETIEKLDEKMADGGADHDGDAADH